jgi:hypothetical protein
MVVRLLIYNQEVGQNRPTKKGGIKMLDGLTLLDQNDSEQLYRLDAFDTVILISNDTEYCLTDWQQNNQPATLSDAADFNWVPLNDVLNWHD